jgi:hypothetical protein
LKLDPSRTHDDTFALIDDFETETFPVIEPADFWDRTRAAGYRSVLIVCLKAHNNWLAILGKTPARFRGSPGAIGSPHCRSRRPGGFARATRGDCAPGD